MPAPVLPGRLRGPRVGSRQRCGGASAGGAHPSRGPEVDPGARFGALGTGLLGGGFRVPRDAGRRLSGTRGAVRGHPRPLQFPESRLPGRVACLVSPKIQGTPGGCDRPRHARGIGVHRAEPADGLAGRTYRFRRNRSGGPVDAGLAARRDRDHRQGLRFFGHRRGGPRAHAGSARARVRRRPCWTVPRVPGDVRSLRPHRPDLPAIPRARATHRGAPSADHRVLLATVRRQDWEDLHPPGRRHRPGRRECGPHLFHGRGLRRRGEHRRL